MLWLPAVLPHLRYSVCHICILLAVVPGVSRRGCFVFLCFWSRVSVVSALFFWFFSLLLPLWCCVSRVFCCCFVWLVFVLVCWVFPGVCGGSVVCVFLLVGCLVVWLCPRFCGAVVSCVLLVCGCFVLVCVASGCSCVCCCSSVCVGSGVLWLVRFFVWFWLFLVVVLCGFYSWCLFLMCLSFVGFCWWAIVPLWLLVLLVHFC